MSETMPQPPEEPETDDVLEHAVVENGADPTECTVYPRDCAEEELLTRWLTAAEGSYVSLDEMR
jgi:hypothetical protein